MLFSISLDISFVPDMNNPLIDDCFYYLKQ